jgi:beta-N-acetylhexosaminidase
VLKRGLVAVLVLAALGLGKRQPVQAAPPVSDQALQAYVAHLSLQRQLGQLFIAYAPANAKAAKQAVAKYHLGGLVLFGVDFAHGNAATKRRIASYQHASTVPLLIATDQEGGSVSRLSGSPNYANRPWLSPQEAYYRGGMPGVLREAAQMQAALQRVGVNWNFAPLADVAPDPKSYIYTRTMGLGYQGTAAYIRQVVPVMQTGKVAATLKHFPGYGDDGNTHTGFAADDRPLTQLTQADLLPFEAGIKQHVAAIMVTHIMLPALDAAYPASLSHKVVTGLLRQKLHYSGIIITDGLEMAAITDFAKAHHLNADVAAVQAGNDCLLNDDYATGIPALAKAVQIGKLSRQQVAASVLRVLKLKRQLGLLDSKQFPPAQVRVTKHQEARRSVVVSGQVYAAKARRVQAVVAGKTVASAPLKADGRYRLRVAKTTAVQHVRLQASGAAVAKLKVAAKPAWWPYVAGALGSVAVLLAAVWWRLRR